MERMSDNESNQELFVSGLADASKSIRYAKKKKLPVNNACTVSLINHFFLNFIYNWSGFYNRHTSYKKTSTLICRKCKSCSCIKHRYNTNESCILVPVKHSGSVRRAGCFSLFSAHWDFQSDWTLRKLFQYPWRKDRSQEVRQLLQQFHGFEILFQIAWSWFRWNLFEIQPFLCPSAPELLQL